MPQVYSQEAAEHRVVPILSRLISRVLERAVELGGVEQPRLLEDWALFRSDTREEFVPPDLLEGEATSSESDDD